MGPAPYSLPGPDRNHRYAASHGTKSCGTIRHAHPVTSTYRIVSITSRRGSRTGSNGSITAHQVTQHSLMLVSG